MGRPKKVKVEDNQGEASVEEPKLEMVQKAEAPKEAAPEAVEPKLKAPEEQMETPKEEDYLRKYQYRKDTPFGSLASDPQKGSKAEVMKKHLLASPKITIFIPTTPGEDKSIQQSVCLNGYRLDFPKNTYLEVPKPVAEVLAESLQQTELALQQGRIDGNSKKEGALL